MKLLLVPPLLLLLAACAGNPIVERTSRDIAKDVVNGVVETRFPGVNAAPYTDCIIDNASTEEILALAQTALTQDEQGAAEIVIDISKRPETAKCLTQSAIEASVGGLLPGL